MDANKRKAMQGRVKKTLEALERNGMNAVYVNDKEEALKLVQSLIPEGAYTATGGSVTLRETGIMEYLQTKTDWHKEYRDAYNASFYLVSANAVTEHGELYEVDGTSNRVSAMLYGPEKVIVVAGINKLVPDLRSAVVRVKTEAAPANCVRLSYDTPCAKTGECVSPSFDECHLGALGCQTDGRICCGYVVFAKQKAKGRITVIIIGEDYGY